MARKPVWYCKVGVLGEMSTPDGCDLPMREAVRRAYKEVTGVYPGFIFSGWNQDLTDAERAVVEP